MPKNPRTIITTVVITLLAILVLQNIRAVTLRVIVWDVTLPLALVVIVSVAIGVGTAWFWRRR